jgi:hypothetical protein
MFKTVALVGLLTLLCGCARYQMEGATNSVWRLDTRTGALDACGWEQGKPTCTPFPAPK